MKSDIPDELVRIAQKGGAVVVLTGAGNLPDQIVHIAAWQGALIIAMWPLAAFHKSPWNSGRCHFLKGPSGELLPLEAYWFNATAKPFE